MIALKLECGALEEGGETVSRPFSKSEEVVGGAVTVGIGTVAVNTVYGTVYTAYRTRTVWTSMACCTATAINRQCSPYGRKYTAAYGEGTAVNPCNINPLSTNIESIQTSPQHIFGGRMNFLRSASSRCSGLNELGSAPAPLPVVAATGRFEWAEDETGYPTHLYGRKDRKRPYNMDPRTPYTVRCRSLAVSSGTATGAAVDARRRWWGRNDQISATRCQCESLISRLTPLARLASRAVRLDSKSASRAITRSNPALHGTTQWTPRRAKHHAVAKQRVLAPRSGPSGEREAPRQRSGSAPAVRAGARNVFKNLLKPDLNNSRCCQAKGGGSGGNTVPPSTKLTSPTP
ncbi:hypothetical protein C8R47DRAFT_1202190 [Mycena vitilis]|nr:hypothetical protein C8R47DRAFT_1204760 [Mycena vitilis]KAJ6462694.1 hypothetical protein C8R47DRAFT_1202190 [Mycena vitilis]